MKRVECAARAGPTAPRATTPNQPFSTARTGPARHAGWRAGPFVSEPARARRARVRAACACAPGRRRSSARRTMHGPSPARDGRGRAPGVYSAVSDFVCVAGWEERAAARLGEPRPPTLPNGRSQFTPPPNGGGGFPQLRVGAPCYSKTTARSSRAARGGTRKLLLLELRGPPLVSREAIVVGSGRSRRTKTVSVWNLAGGGNADTVLGPAPVRVLPGRLTFLRAGCVRRESWGGTTFNWSLPGCAVA